MYVSQPEFFEKVRRLTAHNVATIAAGTLKATTGNELSTPRDVPLHGADYIAWFLDLEGRGILQIVLGFDQMYGSNWVEQWAEQFDREVERLELI